MNLMQSERRGLEGRAYHAGVLPDSEASLAYFSELNSYLYVGGKADRPFNPTVECASFP